jgi:hypothetical protein
MHRDDVRPPQPPGRSRAVHGHHKLMAVNDVNVERREHGSESRRESTVNRSTQVIQMNIEVICTQRIQQPPLASRGNHRVDAVTSGAQ